MGTSFVRLGETGFWANDANLMNWLGCLAEEVDLQGSTETWLREMRSHWLQQASSGLRGMVDPGLEFFVTRDSQRLARVTQVAVQVRKRLLDRMQSACEPKAFAQVPDEELEGLLDVADPFVELLRGKLESTVSSPPEYIQRLLAVRKIEKVEEDDNRWLVSGDVLAQIQVGDAVWVVTTDRKKIPAAVVEARTANIEVQILDRGQSGVVVLHCGAGDDLRHARWLAPLYHSP